MRTQTLKPYSEYAAVDLPWIEQIPKHWAIERAKWLFQRMDRPVRPDDDVVTCFRDGIVTLRKKRRVRGFTESLKEIGYQGVHEGDLVIHAMDAFAGAAGVSDSDGKCTPVYAVCQPKQDADPLYYAHIVREMARTQWIAALAKGIRERSTDFRFGDFASQVVPVPSMDEQECIVAFLAHAGRRINRLIRAKRRLIELLNEQKQAIIQRAVTRGLDPNVRLKPSGIDWLGDVPEHWDVLRAKYVFREVDERSTTGDETHLSMSQKHGLVLSSLIEGHRLISESYVGARLCQQGDIVLNRLKAHLGVFALAKQRGLVSPDYTVFRPVMHIEPRFFELALRTPACRTELRRRAKGIVEGLWRLYTHDFYDIRLPVPDFEEQRSILDRIDSQAHKVQAAIDRVEREMALLREYRARLIDDVVTGKLDVRGVELPALDEDEPLEDWPEGAEEEADETTETEVIALANV